ncbi:MAG: alpha/beta fold hydrolase [Acidobacteriota bacterium]
MPFLGRPGFRLHFQVSGQGPPLVLLPGWTLNLHLWDPVAALLEERRTVARMDTRGTGLSAAPPSLEFSRVADAEDLFALLDHLGWGAAHVAGHSQGARTAMTAALWRPGRFLSVTLLGAGEPPPPGSATFRTRVSAWVAELRERARREGLEAVREALKGARLFGKMRTSADGLGLLRRATAGYEGADLLSEVPRRTFPTEGARKGLPFPVLFAAGEEDPFQEECRYAHTAVPGSRLRIIGRCGHMAPLERPEEVARILLEQTEAAGPA